MVDYLALALIDISYFQFVRHFLDLSKNDPLWDNRFALIVNIKLLFFSVILLFHYLTFNEPLADSIVALFIAAGFLFTIVFISLAITFNAYSILRGQGLWTLVTEIGISLEIILFSVALAYRLRIMREEEQKAKMVLEVDALKNKFFTNISHEFRTPLTIINGISEVAKSKIRNLDTSGLFDSIKKIRNQSDKLLNLVNQILGLTKLETKSLKLNSQNLELVHWLDNVVSDFSDYALQKGIDLIFSTTLEEIHIYIDAQQLKTVVNNLISNAIKFTPAGGRVDVVCTAYTSEGADGVTISIKDTGIGISKDDQLKVFERFFQVDRVHHSSSTGSGVGLAMCKEIISLLKGTINVSSELGKGTTFEVWLPLNTPNSFVDSEEVTLYKDQVESEDFIFPFDHEERPLALIVDDNNDILDFLEQILEDRYTILTAINGKDGIEKAINSIPDIVISDIMMPVMDGYELCEKIKNDKRTDHIPVILLTAKTEQIDRLKGWEKGADAFLTKPFESKELELIIENLYSSRKLLQERFSDFSFVEDKEKLKKESSFIQNIHRILEDNLNNPELTVEDLAKQMFMSRMQLHRKIKALANKSASHYLRSFRLHKAKLFLKDLNVSISNVAYDVGFQSPNYFSRSFHQEFGLTPTEYRESLL